MLLEVLASLLFILLPGDPDLAVVQVVQGPVTSTVPGVQHRVGGKLNLKHKETPYQKDVSPQGSRTECLQAQLQLPTVYPQEYTCREGPVNSKTIQDYLCTLQVQVS